MTFNMSAWYTNLVNVNVSTTAAALQWKRFTTPVQLVNPTSVDLGTGQFLSTYQSNTAGNFSLNVFMRVIGGLRGQYYGFTDFSSRPYAWRIDPMVNFSWGYESPFTQTGVPANAMFDTPFPCDRFSVVWSGHLLPPASEITRFYFEQSSNTGVMLSVNGTTVIDALSPLGGAQTPYGDFLLTAGAYHSIFVYVSCMLYLRIACIEDPALFLVSCIFVNYIFPSQVILTHLKPSISLALNATFVQRNTDTSARTLATRPSRSRGRRSRATRR